MWDYVYFSSHPHHRLLLFARKLSISLLSFFFSSRRRHTRLQGDWSSDVCSSDLIDVRRAYLLAFALGTALAGAAGTLVSVGYSISPSIGLEWTLKALIVVVLAGLGDRKSVV